MVHKIFQVLTESINPPLTTLPQDNRGLTYLGISPHLISSSVPFDTDGGLEGLVSAS